MAETVDPKLLQCFLALLDTCSFKLAAERLGQSQSATTKSLQRLEAALGCKLFDRTTRSVIPTQSALNLRLRAEEAMRGLDAFNAEARLIAGGAKRTLRVATIVLAVESLVAPALARFNAKQPDTQVEVIVGSADVYNDLATGKCDLVVGDSSNYITSPHANALRMQPLHNEPLVAVYRQHHPAAQQPTLETLLNYPWAIPSRYFGENSSLRALANRVQSGDFPQYRMTSLSACLILAANSDSVALAPLSVAAREPANGLAYYSLGTELGTHFHVGLALFTLARLSPTSAVREFQNALSEELAYSTDQTAKAAP